MQERYAERLMSWRGEYLSGAQSIAVPVNDVAPGTYLVTVSTNGVSYTQQVVIK